MSVRSGQIYIDTNTSNHTLDIRLDYNGWTVEPNILDLDDPPNVLKELPGIIGLRNWGITPTNPVDEEERTYLPRPRLTWGVPKLSLQNITYTFDTTTTTTINNIGWTIGATGP